MAITRLGLAMLAAVALVSCGGSSAKPRDSGSEVASSAGGSSSGGSGGGGAGGIGGKAGGDGSAMDAPADGPMDAPPDGAVCPTGQFLIYATPGCGASAHAVCVSGVDACAAPVCACDGTTVIGCGEASVPWVSLGVCPDAGTSDALDARSDGD